MPVHTITHTPPLPPSKGRLLAVTFDHLHLVFLYHAPSGQLLRSFCTQGPPLMVQFCPHKPQWLVWAHRWDDVYLMDTGWVLGGLGGCGC